MIGYRMRSEVREAFLSPAFNNECQMNQNDRRMKLNEAKTKFFEPSAKNVHREHWRAALIPELQDGRQWLVNRIAVHKLFHTLARGAYYAA